MRARAHDLAGDRAVAGATTLGAQSAAPDPAADLAKQLQNPVSNLISVPIESNWEFGDGPTHATAA